MEIRAHVKRPIGLLLLGGLVFHLLELPTFSLWGDLDFEGIRGCECLEKRGEDRHLRALLSDQ